MMEVVNLIVRNRGNPDTEEQCRELYEWLRQELRSGGMRMLGLEPPQTPVMTSTSNPPAATPEPAPQATEPKAPSKFPDGRKMQQAVWTRKHLTEARGHELRNKHTHIGEAAKEVWEAMHKDPWVVPYKHARSIEPALRVFFPATRQRAK
jgi:hypothetical protein